MEPCRHMPWRGQLEHQKQGIGEGETGRGHCLLENWVGLLKSWKGRPCHSGLIQVFFHGSGWDSHQEKPPGAVLLLSEALQAGPHGQRWEMFHVGCTHSKDAFGSTSQEEDLPSTTPFARLNQV